MAESATNRTRVSLIDASALCIGVVVGAGIFRTPSLVVSSAGSVWAAILLWVLGGFVSLVGALCYAELAMAYPHEGGDYTYLHRAFGGRVAFMFAWARMTVIQTGSIALLAFLVGDYASRIFSFGPLSPAVYATLTVMILTTVNIIGIRPGFTLQKILTASIIGGIVLMIIGGLAAHPSPPPPARAIPGWSSVGRAMIFILLTYGGWNEAVYLSAEVKNPRRDMVRVLAVSIGIITALYVGINYVFLATLGAGAAGATSAIGADFMARIAGTAGARVVSVFIVVAALSTINGAVITGARTCYALGCDVPAFGFMGRWRDGRGTPVNALITQAALALVLVLMGTSTRSGFETMVDYTAPVFWGFFFLAGVSLFVLRIREPGRERPFCVPLYPLTPLVFCCVCLYMLWSSLAYAGRGALVGVAVMAAGVVVLMVNALMTPRASRP